jgi:hypothetical protein
MNNLLAKSKLNSLVNLFNELRQHLVISMNHFHTFSNAIAMIVALNT